MLPSPMLSANLAFCPGLDGISPDVRAAPRADGPTSSSVPVLLFIPQFSTCGAPISHFQLAQAEGLHAKPPATALGMYAT